MPIFKTENWQCDLCERISPPDTFGGWALVEVQSEKAQPDGLRKVVICPACLREIKSQCNLRAD